MAFEQFRREYGYSVQNGPDIEQLAQFIAYLSWRGYAGSTIATYTQGISFFLKSQGLTDLVDNFIIRRLVDGCRRKHARRDTRCPITLSILQSLLAALPHICASDYDAQMFKAAFMLAFFAFLRISEFTSSRNEEIALHGDDVSFHYSRGKKFLHVHIRKSKTDQMAKGTVIRLPEGGSIDLCPVRAISNYMKVRSTAGLAFFTNFEGSPLSRQKFSMVLKKATTFCKLPVAHYSSHSFRIGAATSAAARGISEAQIKRMGRWASDAFRAYVRVHSSMM